MERERSVERVSYVCSTVAWWMFAHTLINGCYLKFREGCRGSEYYANVSVENASFVKLGTFGLC